MTSWRLNAQIDDIRVPLAEVHAAGEACALATLVAVEGSAPREPGAQMLVTASDYWGFLSGGCIEADVARHARAAMAERAPRLLRYGEGSPWIAIRLACGSAIDVLVEPVAAGDPAVEALLAGFAARRPVLWRSDGARRTATACDEAAAFGWDGAGYARLFEPAARLVLIGADATDPAEALRAIGSDAWTAVAVLSHDREDDERALAGALMSEACYVGAIGARARLEGRLAKLRAHGVSAARLARLHAPIGLHGFGKAPREIALSLVAEVAQAFHAASTAARSAGQSISRTAPAASLSR